MTRRAAWVVAALGLAVVMFSFWSALDLYTEVDGVDCGRALRTSVGGPPPPSGGESPPAPSPEWVARCTAQARSDIAPTAWAATGGLVIAGAGAALVWRARGPRGGSAA